MGVRGGGRRRCRDLGLVGQPRRGGALQGVLGRLPEADRHQDHLPDDRRRLHRQAPHPAARRFGGRRLLRRRHLDGQAPGVQQPRRSHRVPRYRGRQEGQRDVPRPRRMDQGQGRRHLRRLRRLQPDGLLVQQGPPRRGRRHDRPGGRLRGWHLDPGRAGRPVDQGQGHRQARLRPHGVVRGPVRPRHRARRHDDRGQQGRLRRRTPRPRRSSAGCSTASPTATSATAAACRRARARTRCSSRVNWPPPTRAAGSCPTSRS